MRIERIGVGVGVVLYSRAKKVAAGFHVLMSHSPEPNPSNPTKYADTAIPYALRELKLRGIEPPLSVAIAGGASMLRAPKDATMGTTIVTAVKEALAKANLEVKLEQTGGSRIHSILLDIDGGKIAIT